MAPGTVIACNESTVQGSWSSARGQSGGAGDDCFLYVLNGSGCEASMLSATCLYACPLVWYLLPLSCLNTNSMGTPWASIMSRCDHCAVACMLEPNILHGVHVRRSAHWSDGYNTAGSVNNHGFVMPYVKHVLPRLRHGDKVSYRALNTTPDGANFVNMALAHHGFDPLQCDVNKKH